jgi:hypothetical protein
MTKDELRFTCRRLAGELPPCGSASSSQAVSSIVPRSVGTTDMIELSLS